MTPKKFKNIVISILLFIATIEISVITSDHFLFRKIAAAEVAKRSMPEEAANAVKHAYVASLTYSTFRTFFFTENAAKNITIFLGKSNEIAEIIFKLNRDSTLEMMKDLGNNLLGICAAKLIEENSENPAMQDRISLIGNFAEKGKLILSPEDIVLGKDEKEKARKTSSYFSASKWFMENEEKISCNFVESDSSYKL